MPTLQRIWIYLWPRDRWDLRLRVLWALSFLLVSKLLYAGVPFLYKYAVDSLGPNPTNPSWILSWAPLTIILAYGGVRILAQFFLELKDSIFARCSQNALRAIALDTFVHLHQLSLNFHLDRQTGGLSRAIERGTKGLQFVLQFMVFNILPTLLEIVLVTLILLVVFPWYFAVIIFATILIYIAYTLGITEWRVQFRKTMNEMDSEANSKAIDSLLNYETVKYFGNEEHEFRRFDQSLRGYEEAAVRSQTSLSVLNVGQGLIIGLGLAVVMALAAQNIQKGEMTLGDFVMVNTYLIQLYLPLNFLGFVYREIKQGLIDAEKMFELLDVHPSVRDPDSKQDLKLRGGEVSFDSIDFSYLPNRKILKNVAFRVPAGKRVAIVGPSGSGKSTLARLLYRFYDVTAGSIRIDGQDIREVTQSSLRRSIGVVPQDTVLFNESVFYNIQYGRPDASAAEVEHAADLAQIGDFIRSLPQKFETRVGERGLKLSGGEKQRVAIARTILKNPQILIFDEATSALDSQTESEIVRSLRAVSEQKTTLVIAHRLSTVVDCDEILVLVDGVVVERGTHEELLRANGDYARMWKRQQENRSEAGGK